MVMHISEHYFNEKDRVTSTIFFFNEMQNKASIVTNPNLCPGLIRFANFQRSYSLFLGTAGNDVEHDSVFTMLI